MRDSIASLRHKIGSAQDLESVVRSMKTIASSSIGQYEKAVRSLDDYYQTVQLGLVACLSSSDQKIDQPPVVINRSHKNAPAIGVIVFGSDQGLVGQFNETMVEFVVQSLAKLPGEKTVWAIGERIQSRLLDTELSASLSTTLKSDNSFELPNSINTISALVGSILIELEAQRERGDIDKVYIFYHRPESGSAYKPIIQQLLPLDATWQSNLIDIEWPTNNLPEVMSKRDQTLRAFVREYLFVSLFRACAESLASENASRLAAMQRAEKNIEELQEDLNRTFHRLRQSSIDEELFDVLSGFSTLN
jgi:F-type H+-transporting ATPase subunit gamma